MLSKNNKFYRNSHVVFVTECVVRTVHFLKRQDTSCITLNRALALLAAILNGYDDMQISALNISPVLEMLKTILEDKVEMGGGTALQATAVLNSIMENRLVASQFDMRLLEWLSTILEGSMSQLSKLAMPNNKDAMLLMIGVSASTSRLCASLWFVDVEAAMIEKYTRKIARILLECIQDVCVPFILVSCYFRFFFFFF
ncbi:hypothetical protein C0J52_22103 [Blattella germanica]|nr:hypothetical protein C0J52_22103 [Blattella germanica]